MWTECDYINQVHSFGRNSAIICCPSVIIFLTRLIWIEFWELSWRTDKHRITMVTLLLSLHFSSEYVHFFYFQSFVLVVFMSRRNIMEVCGWPVPSRSKKVWKMSESIRISLALLSIEWNSIRLGGPAHGILTKMLCLKLGLAQLFPVRSIPHLQKQFITSFICLYLCFWCQWCQLSRILGQSKVNDNRGFWQFNTVCQCFGYFICLDLTLD